MNNTDKLLREMRSWLMLPPDDKTTMLECFEIANSYEKWKVEMFYIHFAPCMARVLDEKD